METLRRERGGILIDVLVAMALLAMLVVVIDSMTTNRRLGETADRGMAAIRVAEDCISYLRAILGR